MAAHEESRAKRLDPLDRLPVGHVDDADRRILEIRRGQHGPTLMLEGDAGSEVRHAGQLRIGDLASDVQVDHLPMLAVAGGADDRAVVLIAEEVVEHVVESDPTHRERAVVDLAFQHARLVVVDEAFRHRRRVLRVGDFPELRDVLERHEEARSRRRRVHRAHARRRPLSVVHRNDLHRAQVAGVQHDQGRGQNSCRPSPSGRRRRRRCCAD